MNILTWKCLVVFFIRDFLENSFKLDPFPTSNEVLLIYSLKCLVGYPCHCCSIGKKVTHAVKKRVYMTWKKKRPL